MSNYIGIDLGTSFSAVSHIDESGMPKIVPDDMGENITPSCVQIVDGKFDVGSKAEYLWRKDQKRAAARFKRDMGTSTTHTIGDKKFTPTELSAAVLKKLKGNTEGEIGDITEAVITIPANFSQEAREATMEAANLAGLSVQYIINEPTAAALYYAYTASEEMSGHYVVFDLGGGTFDVSVIEVNGQDIKVIASNGLAKLGGDDFDRILWDLVARKYHLEVGTTIDTDNDMFSVGDAEKEKISLSNRKDMKAFIGREQIVVTRLEFEEAISPLLTQIEMMCETTLEEAHVTKYDIKVVLMAGGSTRMPCVIDTAKKVFDKDITIADNVDEIVSLGASLYAAYMSDGTHLSAIQEKSISKMKLSEVTNEYFGTLVMETSESKGAEIENSILIEKGQTIPCSVTKAYQTVYDGQDKIDCQITESKSPETNPKFVKVIRNEPLSLPPGRPKGQKIEVTYSYDANQMMNAEFLDVASGKRTSIAISKASDSKTDSDIDKFLVD